MSRIPRPNTTQIRPSITVDTAITLEALAKDKPLGLTLEQLLEESPTYRMKKQQLKDFKEN
jgi:hypothetical protein